MSDPGLNIPVSTPGADASLAALLRIATAVEAVGAKAEKASADTGKLGSAFDAIGTAAQHFNSLVTAVSTVSGAIDGAVTRVAALAAEQERLDAMSSRLGLNFDAAADAAGRFTDETTTMQAASEFAARGINLSQTELNDLERVAGRAAQTLGISTQQATQQLTEALIRGKERGLAPFGTALADATAHGYTLGEGLAALHTQAGRTEQATDDAATSVERYRDMLDDAKRSAASAFTTEIARLVDVSGGFRGAAHDAGEFKSTMEAIGRTAASILGRITLAVATVAGGIATAIGGLIDTASLAEAATHGLAAFNAERDRLQHDGAAATAWHFTQQSATALENVTDDAQHDRTTWDPTAEDAAAARGPHSDMTFSAEEASGHDPRNRQITANGGASAARARALREARRQMASDSANKARQAAEDERERREQLRHDSEQTANAAQEKGRENADDLRQHPADDSSRMADQLADKERQRLDTLREAHESYTGRLAELHGTQIHGAEEAAKFTDSALKSTGDALAKHVQALVQGKESVGQALKGMLADTLPSIGQQAIVKGAMETAEGIAALAGIYTAALAPGHFAAAAAYFGVGSLATVAGGALSASSSSASSGSGAGASSGRAASVSSPSSANNTASQAPITINYNAPVFGGREGTDAEVGTRLARFNDATATQLRRSSP